MFGRLAGRTGPKAKKEAYFALSTLSSRRATHGVLGTGSADAKQNHIDYDCIAVAMNENYSILHYLLILFA